MSNLKIAPSVVKVLQIITLDKAVTPDQINEHMGNEYASKHICYLRKLGYEFDTVKAGRKITSYKLVKVPDNDDEIRAYEKPVKAKAAKAPKAPKAAKPKSKASIKPKAKSVKEIKAANLAKLKEVAEKRKSQVEDDAEEDMIDTDLMIQSSFNIDEDFDTFEGINLAALI